ncbi:MAG: hypothetical protein MJE77_26595 [Proteobacteria bacterium]|nr:hypothetical protein [Pseudomonadota bacterium]
MTKNMFDNDLERAIAYFAQVIQRRGMPGSIDEIREQIGSLVGERSSLEALDTRSDTCVVTVRNRAFDLLRKQLKWRRPVEYLARLAESPDRTRPPPCGGTSPVDAGELKGQLQKLNEAILNVARRNSASGQALVLCALAGLSTAEAAEWVGCNRNTMQQRLHRGIEYLSQEMDRLI